ncbi:NAD-dependent epimerase/dehydratase family protein [Butyrivibrio sp. AE3003]|uniref:NAD-dependent epimerase/dehydratase family protein n=1 Tax=Butyrivibrio sp. AE3003 TaxID=1496721 RepID=UPI00047BBC2B|nr:NAD-dependent epimerase/dehydratase family protein [Butyrivibrio sp. AE3003]
MSKRKILITGGNGFIGRRICEECNKNGDDFLVVGKNDQNVPFPYKCISADILDKDSIRKIVSDYRPDAVIHLAGIAAPVNFDFSQLYQVNVLGTEYMLDVMSETLDEHTRFVVTSTAGVYGNQEEKFLNESLAPDPVNHYSFSKMITEVLTKHKSDYLDTCIVRPFTVVGAGQTPRFFVPKLVKMFAEENKEINVGNLEAVRDYVHVDYCAKVIYDIATSDSFPKGIMNICSGEEYSCSDVIDKLISLTGFHPNINSTTEFIRTNEIWRLVGDKTKLNEFVKGRYECKSLEDVLREMLENYSIAEKTR